MEGGERSHSPTSSGPQQYRLETDRDAASTSIVAIEDEAGLANLYEMWLDDLGAVRTFVDPEAGLQATRAGDVDVLILDRCLGEYRGEQLLERVRAATDDCCVAMVTSIRPDTSIAALPVDTYVQKPIAAAQLREAVRRFQDRLELDADRRRFYALAERKAAIEQAVPASELVRDDDYAALERRLERLADELGESLAAVESEGALVALFDE